MNYTESKGKRTYHYEDGFLSKPIINKNICRDHYDDDFIDEYISKNGIFEICDYCDKRKKVIPFNDFFGLLKEGFNFLFEVAEVPPNVDFDALQTYYGGRGPFNLNEIINNDKIGLSFDNSTLKEDITKCLKDDFYYFKDGFATGDDFFMWSWYIFNRIVKHQARFVFYFKNAFCGTSYLNPIDLLNKIQNDIINIGLIKFLKPSSKIYRCVQHMHIDDVKSDGKRIASNPQRNCLSDNRMSPAGVSMFYGSNDFETTVREVVKIKDNERPWYTYAYFTPVEVLKLVDLTKLPTYPSIFDKEKNEVIHSISFLKHFVKDISKPVTEKNSIEYVPTQIVTEYIKYNPELNVDGIIYPSSKKEKTSNYVLFMDHEESLNKLKYHYKSKVTKHITDPL